MDEKVQWGILGTATIAVEQVIPALLKSKHCTVRAIASRKRNKAEVIAKKFNIFKYYGSYQDLLEDTEIQAVYIPLPNHLHVEWAIKAFRAGKHVLVEKPIALSSIEAQKLVEESKKYPMLAENQQAQLFGTQGSIVLEIPFNPPKDWYTNIWLIKQDKRISIDFEVCDQYALQADAFSCAILGNKNVPVGLEDAINNMVIIEKLKESHRLGKRIRLAQTNY